MKCKAKYVNPLDHLYGLKFRNSLFIFAKEYIFLHFKYVYLTIWKMC